MTEETETHDEVKDDGGRVWSYTIIADDGKTTNWGYTVADTMLLARAKIKGFIPDMQGTLRIIPSAMTPNQYRASITRMKANSK